MKHEWAELRLTPAMTRKAALATIILSKLSAEQVYPACSIETLILIPTIQSVVFIPRAWQTIISNVNPTNAIIELQIECRLVPETHIRVRRLVCYRTG